MTLGAAERNPYFGPESIAEGGGLYGRKQEVDDVRDLLMTGRILLLYSPSGAGKTSLIQAGLLPALRKDSRLRVLFVRNFRGGLGASDKKNRYLTSVCKQLGRALPETQEVGRSAVSTPDTLESCLSASPDSSDSGEEQLTADVLVLDQFEEVFTLDPLDLEARRTFLQELGAALRDRSRMALISIREAHVAKLDPYLHLFPTGLRNRYRLGLLDYASALEAITMDGNVRFEPGAAEALLESLWAARARAEEPGPTEAQGAAAPREGAWVEPVLLQVVCANLWEACRASERITKADVARPDLSVDQAIAAQYARVTRRAAEEGKTPERDVRDWVEARLITPGGALGAALYDPVTRWGLPDAAVDALDASHLVRLDVQSSRKQYELTNELLIRPIQRDNERWRAENYAPLQAKARHWQHEGRPDRLLLSIAEWVSAFKWTRAHRAELRKEELDFWRASYWSVGKRAAPYLLVVLCAGLFLLWYRGHQQKLLSDRQAILLKLDKARELSTERSMDHALELSAAALAEVLALRDRHQSDSLELPARNTVLSVLRGAGDLRRMFVSREIHFEAVAFHPTRQAPLLAYGGTDGKAYLASLTDTFAETLEACRQPEIGRNEVTALVFDPTGKFLASGCRDGTVSLWSAVGDGWEPRASGIRVRNVDAKPGTTTRVAFSSDGRLLAVASSDTDTVKVMSVALPDRVGDTGLSAPTTLPLTTKEGVHSLAISPVSDTLLVGDGKGHVWSCELAASRPPTCQAEPAMWPLRGGDQIRSIAFSPDGTRVAIGHLSGDLELWDAELSSSRDLIDGGPARWPPVYGALFIAQCDALYLAIARGTRLQYRPIDLTTGGARQDARDRCPSLMRRAASIGEEVRGMAFHGPTQTLAVAVRGGYVAVLEPGSEPYQSRATYAVGGGTGEKLRGAVIDETSAQVRLLVPEVGPQPELGNLNLITLQRTALRNDDAEEAPKKIAAGKNHIDRLSASVSAKRIATIESVGQKSVPRLGVWELGVDVSNPVSIRSLDPDHFAHLVPRRVALSPNGRLAVWAFERPDAPRGCAPDTRAPNALGSKWTQLLVDDLSKDGESGRTWVATELSRVREIAFSADGKFFAAGGEALVRRPDAGLDRVQTWTVGKGGLEQRRHEPMYLSRLANCVHELGFAEDAKKWPLVLAGAELGRIDVWEASSGRSRDSLRADSQPIWQLAFDRDGAVLAAADMNGAVRLWSTANWSRKEATTPTAFELTPQLDRPPSHPGNLVIGGKGEWLALTSDVLTFWDLDVRELHRRVCEILRDPGQHGADSPPPTSRFCALPISR